MAREFRLNKITWTHQGREYEMSEISSILGTDKLVTKYKINDFSFHMDDDNNVVIECGCSLAVVAHDEFVKMCNKLFVDKKLPKNVDMPVNPLDVDEAIARRFSKG